MDPNKYYFEEQSTLKNWTKYLDENHERNNQMWNSILYNQFVNEEVRRLNKKIYFLKDDLKKERDNKECLRNEIMALQKEVSSLKPKNVSNKRKESWLNSEKNKRPKNYKNLGKKEISQKLKIIFSNMRSIDDIIDFEKDVNRFNFLKNEKYQKLYRLIPSCKKLNQMLGMNKIKDDIFKKISYFLHGLNETQELNHVVITGDPGVGKTTLAKIIGDIYLAMDFLKNDNFVQVKRSDLIAQYCGQTAVKTQKVIDSAEGGVLFIDEVYSLGNSDKKDAFTKECIDTINQNLTEKSDKFLCIVAGYKDEVEKCFFNYNKGLERRFTVKFELDNYNVDSLYGILEKFIEENEWVTEANFKDKLVNLIKDNKNLLKYQGGDMKTIFQYAKEFYSLRLLKESINTGCGNKRIKYEDFELSFEKFKTLREDKDKVPDYLKGMYV